MADPLGNRSLYPEVAIIKKSDDVVEVCVTVTEGETDPVLSSQYNTDMYYFKNCRSTGLAAQGLGPETNSDGKYTQGGWKYDSTKDVFYCAEPTGPHYVFDDTLMKWKPPTDPPDGKWRTTNSDTLDRMVGLNYEFDSSTNEWKIRP